MWPLNQRLVLIASFALAVAVASFASGWKANGMRLTGKHDAELVKLYDAGKRALAAHDAKTKEVILEYREKLDAANSRPPRRVRFCPDGVPRPAGGTAGASTGVVDNHDYGPDLRAARDALIRCNALIGVLSK